MGLWGGTYSRLPHGFWEDERVLEAGENAAAALLKLSDFADRNETDGKLTRRQVEVILSPRRARRVTTRLQACNLLAADEQHDGYQIVGWLEGHRTAAEMAKLRRNRRSAGSQGGKARAANQARRRQDGKQTATGALKPLQSSTEQTRKPPPAPSAADPVDNPPVAGAAAVQLADRLLVHLGYVDELANDGERAYVDRALRRGWHPQDLEDAARDIAGMDPAEIERTPRHVLRGALKQRANTDPPEGHQPPPGPSLADQADQAWIDSMRDAGMTPDEIDRQIAQETPQP